MGAIWGTRACPEHFIPPTGMVLGYIDGASCRCAGLGARRPNHDPILAHSGRTRHFLTEIISVRPGTCISARCSIRTFIRPYLAQVYALIREDGPPGGSQIKNMLKFPSAACSKTTPPGLISRIPISGAPETSGRAGGVFLGRGDHGGSICAGVRAKITVLTPDWL